MALIGEAGSICTIGLGQLIDDVDGDQCVCAPVPPDCCILCAREGGAPPNPCKAASPQIAIRPDATVRVIYSARTIWRQQVSIVCAPEAVIPTSFDCAVTPQPPFDGVFPWNATSTEYVSGAFQFDVIMPIFSPGICIAGDPEVTSHITFGIPNPTIQAHRVPITLNDQDCVQGPGSQQWCWDRRCCNSNFGPTQLNNIVLNLDAIEDPIGSGIFFARYQVIPGVWNGVGQAICFPGVLPPVFSQCPSPFTNLGCGYNENTIPVNITVPLSQVNQGISILCTGVLDCDNCLLVGAGICGDCNPSGVSHRYKHIVQLDIAITPNLLCTI